MILLVPLHQVHLAPHQPHHIHQSPPNKTKTCQSVFLSIISHSQLPQPIYSLLPPNFTYTFESFTPLNNHHEAFS